MNALSQITSYVAVHLQPAYFLICIWNTCGLTARTAIVFRTGMSPGSQGKWRRSPAAPTRSPP